MTAAHVRRWHGTTNRRARTCFASLVALSALFTAVPDAGARGPAPTERDVTSGLGSYLAGRIARNRHDTAVASHFYRGALARDASNHAIVEQALMMEAAEGHWTEAESLAKRIVASDDRHRVARLVLGVGAFAGGRLEEARQHFEAGSVSPIGEVTGALALAWIDTAAGDGAAASERLRKGFRAEWAKQFFDYHRALAADVGGRTAEAESVFTALSKGGQRPVRIVLAHARHAAHGGNIGAARALLRDYLRKSSNPHPDVQSLLERLGPEPASRRKRGERARSGVAPAGGAKRDAIPLLVSTPRAGLAEMLYGLGEALTSEGGLPIGAVYLQLALELDPGHERAITALASVHEATRRFESANAIYDRIPAGNSLGLEIAIKKALNLNQLDKVDEAKALLDRVIAEHPRDLRPLDAAGNILRARKRFAEAVQYYSKAIALIGKPEKKHWAYFYQRGTCYERLKQWAKAEPDLKRAMALSKDQALVLNYLGYSWVDQGINLQRGLTLIERAVQLKPDDGYIVDSLGWAHYKLGNFEEAVKHLDRAVELRPEDPVLNDHLGDAYWKVGRRREARFQWQQALTLEPEPDDAAKIREKLEKGLVEAPQRQVARTTKRRPRPSARAEAKRKTTE
jgi:tetratricopeptide (TPR) repeat protein